MLRHLTRRPSHGTVVAYLALFVALGGTAYAVNTIGSSDVIDESLLSQDIKNLQVGTSDIALGAVFGSRIRDSGILSSHVVDDTLTGNDINEATLQNKIVLMGGGRTTTADELTHYSAPNGDSLTTTFKEGALTPNRSTTIKQFTAHANQGFQPVTVRVNNGVAGCTVGGPGGTCQNTQPPHTFPANSRIRIEIDPGPTDVRDVGWYFELE